jgi:hypothetical protein
MGKLKYTFHIKTYLTDFGSAVNDYIKRLSANPKEVQKMETAFRGKVALT